MKKEKEERGVSENVEEGERRKKLRREGGG
jgi:hypothetical protein